MRQRLVADVAEFFACHGVRVIHADHPADGLGDVAIVAGDDLEGDAEPRQLPDRLRNAPFGRVVEHEESHEETITFRSAIRRAPCTD